MSVKRVIFIRPGETEWNRVMRWQGHVEIPLNENGRKQAQRLAQFVRNTGITKLYSSALRRAVETAQILGQELGLTPVYDRRWCERDIGHWQGLTMHEIVAWYPEEYTKLQANPDDYEIIGNGESRNQVLARVQAAFHDVINNGDDQVIGIVSHSTAMRVLLRELVPDSNPYGRSFSNMSVTSIMQNENGDWRIVQLDDVTHLEGFATFSVPEVEASDEGETIPD